MLALSLVLVAAAIWQSVVDGSAQWTLILNNLGLASLAAANLVDSEVRPVTMRWFKYAAGVLILSALSILLYRLLA